MQYAKLHFDPPDEGELGPAMLALYPRQRAFVIAMLELGAGPGKYSECARAAGYKEGYSAKEAGARLAHDAKVQAALLEEGRKRMGAAVIVATSSLVTMIEDPTLPAKDRLRAIEMVLNRIGLPSMSEQRITVEHKLSDSEMVKRISELARQLKLDPKDLLGRAAEDNVVDTTFVELPAPGGAEDLGDLL